MPLVLKCNLRTNYSKWLLAHIQQLLDFKYTGIYSQQLNHANKHMKQILPKSYLRIPDSYDAKIVKICNLWIFWAVIQLISPLFKIRQKALLLNAP